MERRWDVCSAVVLLLLLLLQVIVSEGTAVPAVFIFGDSLSDPGNNNYITTLSKANIAPNGIDFPGGVPTGRYSNGRTAVDIIGQLIGFTEFIPPYMAPNTTGARILKGVNYASGAGGILDSSGYILYGRIAMNKQIEYFANTKAQIIAQLGEVAGMELISKAMYSSNIGSNDYVNNYYQPLSPIAKFTPQEVATMLIHDYRAQLTKIYNMGARKMVVAALGPIGCIPFQLSFRQSKNGECIEKVNSDVRLFNTGLFAMVKQLNAQLPGAQFIYADAYKGLSELISNPSQYGLSVVDAGCCGAGGDYKGVIPCLTILEKCKNRFDYLFWDPYHPTDKANVALSHKFYESSDYTYPINIKQLTMLQ